MKREESTQQAVRKMRHPQFDVSVILNIMRHEFNQLHFQI